MTQACLCLCCWVTKTSRKRDNQGQWCQVGGTWFDGLLNNTEGYLFIKCCTSEVPGMGGTWGVFSCFNSTWVAFEPKLYLREGQWKDNAYDAYACSEWRCQSPKSPTETSIPHIHTLRLRSSTASDHQHKGCSQQWHGGKEIEMSAENVAKYIESVQTSCQKDKTCLLGCLGAYIKDWK